MKVKELIEELKKYPQDSECVSISHEHILDCGKYLGPKGGWDNYWQPTILRPMDDGSIFFGVQVTEEHFDKGI